MSTHTHSWNDIFSFFLTHTLAGRQTCSRRTQIWEAELLLTLSQSGLTATPLKEASTIAFNPSSSLTCIGTSTEYAVFVAVAWCFLCVFH